MADEFDFDDGGRPSRKDYSGHRSFLSVITFLMCLSVFFLFVVPLGLVIAGVIEKPSSLFAGLASIISLVVVTLWVVFLWACLRIIIELLIEIAENTARRK